MELANNFFIIECSEKKDKKIFDGKILHDCLRTIEGFKPIYKEINSIKGFKKTLLEFVNSKCKYLFISAHGDEENIFVNGKPLNAIDIEEMDILLDKRRIFMSTCRGGSYIISKQFIRKGAYSVIGPSNDIPKLIAAGMWPTMLVVFDRINNLELADFEELDKTFEFLSQIYLIEMKYFSFIRDNKFKMKEYTYFPNSSRKRVDHSI